MFRIELHVKFNPTEFCTPWPAGLETVAKQEKHFPVTVSKSSYLHSSPSIRDPKARIVTLKVGPRCTICLAQLSALCKAFLMLGSLRLLSHQRHMLQVTSDAVISHQSGTSHVAVAGGSSKECAILSSKTACTVIPNLTYWATEAVLSNVSGENLFRYFQTVLCMPYIQKFPCFYLLLFEFNTLYYLGLIFFLL